MVCTLFLYPTTNTIFIIPIVICHFNGFFFYFFIIIAKWYVISKLWKRNSYNLYHYWLFIYYDMFNSQKKIMTYQIKLINAEEGKFCCWRCLFLFKFMKVKWAHPNKWIYYKMDMCNSPYVHVKLDVDPMCHCWCSAYFYL